MAVEKTEEMTEAAVTEKEEIAANNTAEQEKEDVKLAYIGPTLPSGELKCNKIFIGTETEIKKELQTVIEKYPLVEKMLVPASQMGEKKDKAKTAGNIMHKYYADIVSSIAANVAKEA